MKQLLSILFLLLCFISCEKAFSPSISNVVDASTRAPLENQFNVGEFEEAYPGYEKQLVEFEKGFSFRKVIGIPDTYIYEWDALIDEAGINALIKNKLSTKSAVDSNPFHYWTKGIVYYYFDSAASSVFKSCVEAAMDDIEACCGVIFVPTNSSSTVSLKIVNSSAAVGNNSWVGCKGEAGQVVNIHSYTYNGIIIHELLHALGFFHEHARQDRDDYITINWSNIKPNYYHDFQKYTVTDQGYDISTLDEDSIMMYSSIISDPNFVYDTSVPAMYWNSNPNQAFGGQRTHLSVNDIKGLVSVYGPPYSLFSKTHSPIQHSTEVVDGITYVTTIDSVNVFLRFYLERWNATPTHIQYPRSLVMIKTNVYSDINGDLHRNTFTQNIYANPGDSSKFVDSYVYRKITANGQIVDYYDYEYSVR